MAERAGAPLWAVAELLAHADEVYGPREHVFPLLRIGSSPGDLVAELFIDWGEFRAQIDDLQVHEARAHFPGELLRRSYEAAPDAGLLPGGIDGEQAKVSALSMARHIDAAGEDPGGFRNEERPGF